MFIEIKDEELHEIRTLFAKCDEDGSGAITKDELGSIFKALGQNFSDKERIEMMKNIDLNEDGFVTFNEFLSLYKKHVLFKVQEEKLREAFKICDYDGNEFVTLDELKRVVNMVGENLNEEQIIKMIKKVDIDGDGKINFEEFIQLMKNQ